MTSSLSAEDLAFYRLASYACYQWPNYTLAKHHLLIARHLEMVERGEITRLMITMPPRHGKSMLASEFFPAWYIGRNPDHYVVTATYAQELADDFGRKVKNQIEDDSYKAIFPGVGLADDSKSAKRFHIEGSAGGYEHATSQRGAFYAVGVGGPLTGRGAHLLLIDDPVKNREDAESEVIRKKTKDWYTSTAYTRLMPGGRIVIIQTRWHEDDLSGWLQTEHAHEGWVVLDLPAIDDDGNALWPEQYSVDDLLRIKKALPPRDWSALYQQRPSPDSGDYFKKEWIHEVDHLPPVGTLRIYGGSDYAVTQNGGDYTVHAVVGIDPQHRLYLLDLWRQQASSDRWVEAFCDLVKKWRPIGWAEETGQIKSGVGPFLVRSMIEKEAYVAREQFPTRGDKAIRAQSFRGRIASTGLYIHKDAEWKSDLISEMMSFPVGVHDDQCLIGTTVVDTINGNLPIMDVRMGDYVVTPYGPKRVLASMMTSEDAEVYDVTFSDGRTITSTANHPIFVRGKGFVNVDALCIMDTVVQHGESICSEDRQRLRLSSMAGIGIADTLTAGTNTTGDISTQQSQGAVSFIDTNGKMRSGQSLTDVISTMQMVTGAITTSPTWNAYLRKIIEVGTQWTMSLWSDKKNILNALGILRLTGIDRMKDGSGIERMASNPGKDESQQGKPVNAADQTSLLTSQLVGDSVLAPALSVIAIRKRNERLPVYNLKVEDCPMYYANGILTHNCDALGLVGQLLDRMLAGKPLPEPEPEFDPDAEFEITPPPIRERRRR